MPRSDGNIEFPQKDHGQPGSCMTPRKGKRQRRSASGSGTKPASRIDACNVRHCGAQGHGAPHLGSARRCAGAHHPPSDRSRLSGSVGPRQKSASRIQPDLNRQRWGGKTGRFRPVRGCASARRHRRYPCGQRSNPDRRRADRREAQRERLWAGRIQSRSPAFPARTKCGSRSLPDRSFLRYGMVYNVWVSSNRVPGRTPDRQR